MIEKQGNIDSGSIDSLKPAYLVHEPPYVLLDRLPDKTITESTSKNETPTQVAKKCRWVQPIIQSRISTVFTAT